MNTILNHFDLILIISSIAFSFSIIIAVVVHMLSIITDLQQEILQEQKKYVELQNDYGQALKKIFESKQDS